MEKEIPLVNALTGVQFNVQQLDGRKLLIKTAPGDIIKNDAAREIRNEGMPLFSRPYEHGNLYIKFSVIFPTKLTHKQIAALQENLPDPLPTASKDSDTEECTLKEVDPNNMHQDDGRRPNNTYEHSDSDEEGGGGVQCTQQ